MARRADRPGPLEFDANGFPVSTQPQLRHTGSPPTEPIEASSAWLGMGSRRRARSSARHVTPPVLPIRQCVAAAAPRVATVRRGSSDGKRLSVLDLPAAPAALLAHPGEVSHCLLDGHRLWGFSRFGSGKSGPGLGWGAPAHRPRTAMAPNDWYERCRIRAHGPATRQIYHHYLRRSSWLLREPLVVTAGTAS